MHELSIARQLLDIVAEAATQHDLKRVNRLRVVVGALGNVVPEALEFAFDVAGEGTVAAGAELEIVEVPVNWYYDPGTSVNLLRDPFRMVREVLQVRLNGWRGTYDA